MSRTARIVIAGEFHHITQRGNNRQDVLFDDEDRRVYLAILKEQSEKYSLEILGRRLMTNQIHLLDRPLASDRYISKAEQLLNNHPRQCYPCRGVQ